MLARGTQIQNLKSIRQIQRVKICRLNRPTLDKYVDPSGPQIGTYDTVQLGLECEGNVTCYIQRQNNRKEENLVLLVQKLYNHLQAWNIVEVQIAALKDFSQKQ